MRLRNDNLKTGSMLTCFYPGDRRTNRSLLFLVSGIHDIEPLTNVETLCLRHIKDSKLSEYEWFPIPDQSDLSGVDPNLDVSKITRIEASEFADMSSDDLNKLLIPLLNKLALDEPELLPSAGGAVGGPAEGIQFLNREKELEDLASLIRDKKSVMLVAPRRSGKTSVLLRLKRILDETYKPIYLNLERFRSPQEVAARFVVLTKKKGFRAALISVQEDKTNWQEVLIQSFERLKQDADKPLIVFFDELVNLCQNISTLREEVVARDEITELLKAISEGLSEAGVQTVMAGSMDLTEYLNDHIGIAPEDMPVLFKTIEHFRLPPLSPKDSEIELRRILLGTGLVLEKNDLEWLMAKVDLAIPYPTLNFLDRLTVKVRSRKSLTLRDLDEELDHFIATTDAFLEFDAHLQRIGEKKPRATTAASEALAVIAQEPSNMGSSVEDVRRCLESILGEDAESLLCWLQDTLPITDKNGRMMFMSKVFHKWWQHQMEGSE